MVMIYIARRCAFICHPMMSRHAIGDGCDNSAMKAEMTSALTDGASDSWFSFDISWLEWPNIELPTIYEFSDGI